MQFRLSDRPSGGCGGSRRSEIQRKHRDRPAKALTSRVKEPGTRQRVYRYRFYPTEEQAQQLIQTVGACRWVYNEGLALRSKAWSDHRVSVGFAETSRALTGWRQAEETHWLRDMSSTVLQQALRHLDSAFTRFFRGDKRYPKRKRKHRSRDSATYVRTGFRYREDPERPGTGQIALAKQTDPLDIRWSRPTGRRSSCLWSLCQTIGCGPQGRTGRQRTVKQEASPAKVATGSKVNCSTPRTGQKSGALPADKAVPRQVASGGVQ